MSPAHPARVASGTSGRKDAETGYIVISYILTGVLLYGGLGWLGDQAFHTNLLLPLGILVGAGLSLYIVVKRFGGLHDEPASTSVKATPSREESQ